MKRPVRDRTIKLQHEDTALARGGARLPVYARIADDLLRQIEAGKYPLGSLLPKEIDLSAHYGVSRQTMREALRRLRDTGMVTRRRRAGTVVVAAVRPISYRQPVSSIDDLLQYGEGTELQVLEQSRLACDTELAALLDCEVGREWLRVCAVRVHPHDKHPICLTTSYLNLDLPHIEQQLARLSGRISAMLESHYNLRISTIRQSIQAVRLGAREAKLLLVKSGSPGLRAIRHYYDATARLLQCSDALHAGARFTYATTLKRDGD